LRSNGNGNGSARGYRRPYDYADDNKLDLSPDALDEWWLYQARNAAANLDYERQHGDLGHVEQRERRKLSRCVLSRLAGLLPW
jgi:hypothetical protein